VSHVLDIFSLKGHVALVTGASSGIGHHLAHTLARAGAHVIVAARRADKLAKLVAELKASGAIADAVSLDVTSQTSVKACFDQIETIAGVADIIISNAGTTVAKPALEQTEEDWDNVIDTNLKGCWMVDTEAARRLVKLKKKGSIINIASILGARVAGAVVGLLIGAVRIAQGGHFLSDVVFAGWAVWLTYVLIRQIWLRLRLRRYQGFTSKAIAP